MIEGLTFDALLGDKEHRAERVAIIIIGKLKRLTANPASPSTSWSIRPKGRMGGELHALALETEARE